MRLSFFALFLLVGPWSHAAAIFTVKEFDGSSPKAAEVDSGVLHESNYSTESTVQVSLSSQFPTMFVLLWHVSMGKSTTIVVPSQSKLELSVVRFLIETKANSKILRRRNS